MSIEDVLRAEIVRLRNERDDARVEADSYRLDAFRWRAQEECRRRDTALGSAEAMLGNQIAPRGVVGQFARDLRGDHDSARSYAVTGGAA